MTKRLIILLCVFFIIITVTFFYYPSYNKTSKSMFSWIKESGSTDNSLQWFNIKKAKRIRAVALVVHGLNLRPDRMQSIIAELNDEGIDVLNLSLRGHGNNYLRNINVSTDEARLESFRNVTYELWLNEIYEAYLKVRERASRKDVPVFFIGYSLGGLMGCDLILSQSDILFDRMILFAPALNIKVESYLLKALMPFPNVVIDSISPLSYRANEGTPMAAYKALFQSIEHFEKNTNDNLNKPTLIFIDEDDEFISCSKLKEMIIRRNLDRWQIHILQKDNDVGGKISHHLIIDKTSVGENMWKQIKDAFKKHLNAGA